jgi:hypothetical protein
MLPVILICGCKKYEKYLSAAMKRMARAEYEIIGVLGGAKGNSSYDSSTRILSLAVPDTYEGLPKKIYAAFAWIYKNRPGIPGIFKTDDDMLFHMNSLVRNIRKHQTLPYWGVACSSCQEGAVDKERINTRFEDKELRPRHQKAAYCFGWGYWISKDSLPVIIAAEKTYHTSFLEDVCTGYVLNQAGIKPVRINFPYKEIARGHTGGIKLRHEHLDNNNTPLIVAGLIAGLTILSIFLLRTTIKHE